LTAPPCRSGCVVHMKATLEIQNGPDAGTKAEIARLGSFTIGRRSVNDLKIVEKGTSRKHCRIDYDGEFFWLVDCESHNGTYLNGRRITRSLLYDGDTIRIAHTRLVFAVSGEKAEESAEA